MHVILCGPAKSFILSKRAERHSMTSKECKERDLGKPNIHTSGDNPVYSSWYKCRLISEILCVIIVHRSNGRKK